MTHKSVARCADGREASFNDITPGEMLDATGFFRTGGGDFWAQTIVILP